MIITTSGATFSDAAACAAPCSAAIVTVFLVVNILLILPVDSGVIFPCVLDYFVLFCLRVSEFGPLGTRKRLIWFHHKIYDTLSLTYLSLMTPVREDVYV